MSGNIPSSLPMKVQVPVYGVAFFSNSVPDLVLVVLQLWLVKLGAPYFMIGIVFGARYVGPLLFAIHGGAMMDRLGTQKVIIFFGLIMVLIPFVYPFAPWFFAIILIQIVSGLADSFGWIGAQTLTGQILHGNPTYTGRLIFATRVGTFVGPPIAGAAWDIFGPWGGFTALSFWGMGLLYSAAILPKGASSQPVSPHEPFLRSVTPRITDYVSAFRLFGIPVISVVLMITVIRQFGSGMQSTFYAVYLQGIGMSGTLIGILVSATGLMGIAALGSGWLARKFDEFKLLVITTLISILAIAVVPLFTDFVPLFLASCIRGAVLAISVVIIVSLIARSVGLDVQGMAMGLRMTCNQTANVLVPIVMGFLAHYFGLETAFYIVGLVGILLSALIGFLARRTEVPRI